VYDSCSSYRNFRSGFKPYNAGADSEIHIVLNDCHSVYDAWDEVTQARRSLGGESGFMINMHATGAAKFFIEYNNCVAEGFERSGFQTARGAASGGDQFISMNGCTQIDCNLSNTDGNNRSPVAIPAGAGKTRILIKDNKCVAPAANTAGYGISVQDGENVTVAGDCEFFGNFSIPFQIGGTGYVSGTVTVTTATHTVARTTKTILVNHAGTCTLTLPAAASFYDREILVRTFTANAVVSASSNVSVNGGAAATAILGASAGAWARLVSDGTVWHMVSN
jgi:hypothetical protein